MANRQYVSNRAVDRTAPSSRRDPALDSPLGKRRRSIPFRVLVDAFATEDEELPPEPDWADFTSCKPYH